MLTESGDEKLLISESVATLKIKQIRVTFQADKSKFIAFVLTGNPMNSV